MSTQIIRAYREDGTLSGGEITADPDRQLMLAQKTLRERGHLIIERRRPLEDSWNHRIIGVGFTHNDAEFAEQR